jgi:hypothetical protein
LPPLHQLPGFLAAQALLLLLATGLRRAHSFSLQLRLGIHRTRLPDRGGRRSVARLHRRLALQLRLLRAGLELLGLRLAPHAVLL